MLKNNGLYVLIQWVLRGISVLAVLISFSVSAQKLQFSKIEGSFLSGISEQVLIEAYKQLDIEIELIEFPAVRGLILSNEGVTDGELHRVIKVDYTSANLLRVPTVINQAQVVAFTHNKQFKVDGWASLKPYKIGYVRGIVVIEAGTIGMDVAPQSSYEQVLMMLKLERIEVGVLNRVSGIHFLKTMAFRNIKILEPPILKHALYHYLHIKHKKLLPRVDAVLKRMHASGRIDEIRTLFLQNMKVRQ